ncbi:MAG: N-acetyl-alpha-D-glucosaminyl L-malate synthase BshA [Planctomycetota bacterium]|nr:MAG: N-acetyl-alpha-D-glucosaminyl L-malate synthase BshA [Planctomycetota bacterium]
MKIGVVCYPTYGGSGVVASELAIGMSERKHDVHVFSYQLPFRLQYKCANITFHKVSTSEYPLFKYPPYSLSLANELADKILEFDLDILHSHYAIPHGTCAFLAKEMLKGHKVKTITTLHGTDITLVGKDKSFLRITEHAMEISDGLTSVSHWLKDETYSHFNITKPIEVIPNFIDKEEYRDVELISYPDKKEIPLLCHISNLRDVKRPLDVIEAFNLVLKKIPSKLMIVGEGPGLDSLITLAGKYNILDHITFKGTHSDILDVLPCADILLLPSDRESFGLVALEALGSGIPVVGYNVGGLPEVVKNGENGYLVDVGDISAMADSIISLLKDHQKLSEFRDEARIQSWNNFEKQKIIDQYEDYYQKVLSL